MIRITSATIRDVSTKIDVKVTVNKIAENKYNIYAMPVDGKGNNLLKNPLRRTAKTVEAAEDRINLIARSAAKKAATSSLSARKTKNTSAEPNEINKIVKELMENGVNIYPKRKEGARRGWSYEVCRSTYTYFLNHGFAEFMIKNVESEDYQAELQVFRNGLIERAAASGKSKGNRAQATQSVDAAIKRIQILCGYLHDYYDVFEFSFTKGIIMGKAIPEEQIKSFPDVVFLHFCRELERRVESEPRMVLGAVLMTDGGLRTAEAAGTPVRSLLFRENYGVVAVVYQEKGGIRIDKLKSENGYRNVVLSRWGSWMAKRCIDVLGWTEDSDELIATGKDLSAWVKRLLEEIDSGLMEEVARIEALNPDRDDNGKTVYDVSAYVLRRNTASRWLNYDGLTHEEIDIMLGHKMKNNQEIIYLTDETDQQMIAEKLERYIYNKECTGNLAFSPILLNEKSDIDSIPYPVIRLKNDTDKPIVLKVDVENAEPGENLISDLPYGAARSVTPRSVRKRAKNRISEIIGSNAELHRKE